MAVSRHKVQFRIRNRIVEFKGSKNIYYLYYVCKLYMYSTSFLTFSW